MLIVGRWTACECIEVGDVDPDCNGGEADGLLIRLQQITDLLPDGGQRLVEARTGLRVTNLFDRRYADRADFAQGDFRYFPGAARSLIVDIEYQFGGD